MSKLVIVESPAKGRTIGEFLGSDYDVEASIGHIRDLPQPSDLPAEMKKGPYGRFAVDVDHGFEPYYVVAADKKKKVAELKKKLKESTELLLATDEDREGEAIAWHLYEVLKPKIPVKRMVFHEITPEAIARALDNPRDINVPLVDAQESRRILDRLVGYEISPLLWRKVAPGLSAGRVQSVATRLVVERERERMAFHPASYWSVDAEFTHDGESFTAHLAAVNDHRVATGKDFLDDATLSPKAAAAGVVVLDEASAKAIAQAVSAGTATVTSMETKPYKRRPAPPFTTSTLQQEAGRKLRWSARETMRTAQQLYENGYITYMRTDSTNLSDQALAAARSQIAEMYGQAYVPASPRLYEKKQKGAQEAHEAIRPAGDHFRTPAMVRAALNEHQFKLYELIWKRTVASQMTDALGHTASVKLAAEGAPGQSLTFTAAGTVITFPGFMAAYKESTDAQRYGSQAQGELPQMREGDTTSCASAEPEGHETQPPPRYTEASLVKKMEELGIGRPSTYAATISTITERGYVNVRGQALVPSWTAFAVVKLLEQYLPHLVDYDFTAEMESELDHIAAGEKSRTDYLETFWHGTANQPGLEGKVESLQDTVDARDLNTITIADGIELRVGRYGPYVQEIDTSTGELKARTSVPADLPPDELDEAKARELLASSASDGRELGINPANGRKVVVKNGRFGPYFTEIIREGEVALTPTGRPSKKPPKAPTASLFQSMDIDTVTLEDALKVLSLPRVIGEINGEEVVATNGRYGPYISKGGKDNRTLESQEQIFTITLEEAQALLAQPRTRMRRQAQPPLKELGTDPVSGKPVLLKDGRFGLYVTDGEVNASLRTNDDPNTLTNERAWELLELRRNAAPRKKTTRKKTTAKKTSSAKKTTGAKKTSSTKKASE